MTTAHLVEKKMVHRELASVHFLPLCVGVPTHARQTGGWRSGVYHRICVLQRAEDNQCCGAMAYRFQGIGALPHSWVPAETPRHNAALPRQGDLAWPGRLPSHHGPDIAGLGLLGFPLVLHGLLEMGGYAACCAGSSPVCMPGYHKTWPGVHRLTRVSAPGGAGGRRAWSTACAAASLSHMGEING